MAEATTYIDVRRLPRWRQGVVALSFLVNRLSRWLYVWATEPEERHHREDVARYFEAQGEN